MIVAITNAFCPAAQLARTLMAFNYQPLVDRHIIVNGHYPRNYTKNQLDMKVVMDTYCRRLHVEYWDPGSDLGSAQCQNWALDILSETMTDSDYFINLDPDAACPSDWIRAAKTVLDNDPQCVVVSCHAPMVLKFIETRHQEMQEKTVSGVNVLIPDIPTPFNLSLWRYSFIRDIGGIPQLFPMYGEVEGPLWATAKQFGFYNCYLKDHMEDESGKLMHDECFEMWKTAHAREATFLGNFKEYCELNGLL